MKQGFGPCGTFFLSRRVMLIFIPQDGVKGLHQMLSFLYLLNKPLGSASDESKLVSILNNLFLGFVSHCLSFSGLSIYSLPLMRSRGCCKLAELIKSLNRDTLKFLRFVS